MLKTLSSRTVNVKLELSSAKLKVCPEETNVQLITFSNELSTVKKCINGLKIAGLFCLDFKKALMRCGDYDF